MFAECCDMQNMPLCMQNTPAICANAHASVDYWLLFPNLCKGRVADNPPGTRSIAGYESCLMPRLPLGLKSRYKVTGQEKHSRFLAWRAEAAREPAAVKFSAVGKLIPSKF